MSNTQVYVSKKGGLAVLILLLGTFLVFWLAHSDAKPVPDSCTQAKAEGLYNIPKGSPYYRASLDRNHNNVACEL